MRGVAVRELQSPPALRRLFARAITTGFGRHGDTVPDLDVVLRAVEVDRDHLTEYAHVCGFRVGDTLPVTYPHVLTFPLAMELMADRRFPFPVVGLVHVANRVEVHRLVGADELLDLRVRAGNLRPHPRGLQVDVTAEVRVADELVWTQVSTYLRRGEGGAGPRVPREPDQEGGTPAAVWRVDGATGRRYAAVSGDHNPIHLNGLAARAFGFPRAIAHGMWTAARCLAALEGRLPEALRVDVEFRAPVLLPSTVELVTDADEDGSWRFTLRGQRRGRVHLTGRVAPTR